MDEQFPDTMNWVSARANCSIAQLLNLLRERAASDVKEMLPFIEGTGARLEVHRVAGNKFVVSRVNFGNGPDRNVVFEVDKASIKVTTWTADWRVDLFAAKPSFGPTGKCRLEIDGQPLELWQVSQRALEDLFFD